MDRKVLGAVVVALTLGLASCGGSSTLSKADFTKQANAICKDRRAKVDAAEKGAKEFKVAVIRALPVVEANLDQLAALKPPSELADSYHQLIAIERTQIQLVRKAVSGSKTRSGELPPALREKQAKIKQQLGLATCN